jgi:hypothetical protein
MSEQSRDAQTQQVLRLFLSDGRVRGRLNYDTGDPAQGKLRAAVHVTFAGLLPAVRATSRTGGDYSFSGGPQCRPV